jgi:type 1 glutamine amidotransferase
MKTFASFVLGLAVSFSALTGFAADKKIVLIAGRPSHGPGEHEFRAGCLLLKSCLDQLKGVSSVVYSNGWPTKLVDGKAIDDNSAFAGADAVFIYSDGGGGHPAIKPERIKVLDDLAKKGVGLGFGHYAVEVPTGEPGDAMLRWSGGFFETFWSVNPTWMAEFSKLPVHPITSGVKPFSIRDEWYYHMRFVDNMKDVTPILTAVPPDNTRGKPGANDAHGGNPEVQKHMGEPEHMMWALQRPDGGRGFGFTGGHYHKNWGQDDFRKVVLNAILWTAKAPVPKDGAVTSVTPEQLAANLDSKGQKK